MRGLWWFWPTALAITVIVELWALLRARDKTATRAWLAIADAHPLIAAVHHILTGMLLAWLPLHWLLAPIDPPGFDPIEAGLLLSGAMFGAGAWRLRCVTPPNPRQ